MNSNSQLPIRARQLKLAFARNDLWERFPRTTQSKCRQLLTQMLVHVIRSQQEEGSKDDERED